MSNDTSNTGRCHSCEVMMIQGVRCHEAGCPDAWKEEERDCQWCGSEFSPEYKYDWYCSDDCEQSDKGWTEAGE